MNTPDKADADRLLQCLKRGLCRRSSRSPQNRPAPLHLPTRHVTNLEHTSPSKEIRPGVFYGSPLGKPAPRLSRLFDELHNDLKLQHMAPSSPALWTTFAKQDQAIQFCHTHGNQTAALFTYQDHINGQRRFLVTTYDEFWGRYEKMQPSLRHHYEIIKQGSPCNLYFDIEFNRMANMGADGNTMVDLLLVVVSGLFYDAYSIQYDHSWTMELDSSTSEKFSRHLIIRVPNIAFKDNSQVGAFVAEVCRRISSLREANDCYDKLFVLEGEGRDKHHARLFVDQAVYSRNRSFRLVYSSKSGKTAVLLPTNRYRCKYTESHNIFMDSLICNIGEECQKLLVFDKEVPSTISIESVNFLPLDDMPHLGAFNSSGSSPYPAVDLFVESVGSIENIAAKIRSWFWFAEYGVVVYNITGNRFCERIGRQHKSNHVMYIVDFRVAGYYQKCHDPDCRGYKSPLRPIPRDIIPPEYPLSTMTQYNIQIEETRMLCDGVCLEDHSNFEIKQTKMQCNDQRGCSDNPPFDDIDDDAWWTEVISSMAKIEFTCSQSYVK